MANVKLKSIKFPDLSDTYVVPSTAGDLTYSEDGIYSDGTVGKAIQTTTASLEDYAKVDGSYESMTVGNAEQIVSNVRDNDRTPYVFRTSGGSVDIGDREYINGIVGGSVSFNQIVQNGNFADGTSGWLAYTKSTISASNNVLTQTISAGQTGSDANVYLFGIYRTNVFGEKSHKYLVLTTIKTSEATTFRFEFGGGKRGTTSTISANTKTTVGIIGDVSQYNAQLLIYPHSIIVNSATEAPAMTIEYSNIMCFDLTQMFGSTIADYIYSLETATAGAGVAWFKKLFPKPYYPYNTGELMHVSGLVSHDTVGFNAWDEEWEHKKGYSTGDMLDSASNIASKNYIPVLPNTSYYLNLPSGVEMFMYKYDADKNYIGLCEYLGNYIYNTGDAKYIKFATRTDNYSGNYKNDICINLSWDGSRNGEYEPYVKHSYPLDTDLVLRGIPKLDSGNNLYYDGDIYESDGTVTRKWKEDTIAIESMYTASGNANYDFAVFSASESWKPNTLSLMGIRTSNGSYFPNASYTAVDFEGAILVYDTGSRKLSVSIAKNSTLAQAQAKYNGVKIVYELATPTTETAEPYQSPQIVDDFGTEEYVLNNSIVPVGHDADYPVNLVAKLEMAPNSPSGDGTYVVKQTNGTNEYVPLIIPSGIPSVPTTDGTYKLTVTVTNGTPTLTWEA